MADAPDPPEQRPEEGSLGARALGLGARGVGRLAEATGIDRALEEAAEEAIVRAAESPAVDRAFARILEGPALEEAVARALSSPAVERAILEALDSEMVDRVWQRLLDSDEAQRLVERIAEAPEVRSAIAAQGVGLIEDLGRQVGAAARGIDDVVERVVRAILGRPRRVERSPAAGALSRLVALAIDAAIINAGFLLASLVVGLFVSGIAGGTDDVSTPALIAGIGAWIVVGSVYLLVFWSSVGQTPGMRFIGIHLLDEGKPGIGLRRARRRLLGVLLCVLTLGIGFLGILFRDNRRGLHDRMADTDVLYERGRGRRAG